MFTELEKSKLEKINKLFSEIEDIYLSLNQETQDKILEYHHENASIPHCIRWGIQASEELMKE